MEKDIFKLRFNLYIKQKRNKNLITFVFLELFDR